MNRRPSGIARSALAMSCSGSSLGPVDRATPTLAVAATGPPSASYGSPSVSTILTLFLVPTIYVILEERFPRHADKVPQDVDWIPAEPGQAQAGQ